MVDLYTISLETGMPFLSFFFFFFNYKIYLSRGIYRLDSSSTLECFKSNTDTASQQSHFKSTQEKLLLQEAEFVKPTADAIITLRN